MTVKDLETLFDYGYWADRKLFEAVSGIPPEQFTQSVGGAFGSIRNTLVHIMSAEWGWLERCGGPERGPKLNANDYPTVESVRETWNKIEKYTRKFLSELNDDDIGRNAEYLNDKGEKRAMPLGELMQHAANHGTHHRGQVAMILRLLDHTPGNFDILFYYAEKRGVPAF
jgi:uncharacterized damage-inducible protein DinB